jgi:hypothetical protein
MLRIAGIGWPAYNGNSGWSGEVGKDKVIRAAATIFGDDIGEKMWRR